MVHLLAFGLALCPGLAAFWAWRGFRGAVEPPSGAPDVSLPEAAVLRDGAVGATRWAFAALIVKLARDGHCTLVRTQKRRWVRTGPTLTVNPHADPTALSPLEQTVLRQLARHDTLGGFGFAGSTFRRRTLRDVRTDLVERGWLADRSRRSNACLALGLALLGIGALGPAGGLPLLAGAGCAGLGVGSLIAAGVRYPLTAEGARRRAAHRAFAETQRARICDCLPDRPDDAGDILVDHLPALILERLATPRRLRAVAEQLAAVGTQRPAPEWVRDEIDGAETVADACRIVGFALGELGARTPLRGRLIALMRGQQRVA